MALFKFTDLIINNKPITVYNYGNMIRDFTYIDDVIESILRIINKKHIKNKNLKKSHDNVPYKIFNIGNSQPQNLTDYIKSEEIQPGDVEATFSNTKSLEKWIGFKPNTSIDKGIKNFIEWYLSYYKLR